MAGSFTLASLPRRPGAYFNFRAQPSVLVPPAVGAVVAVPFTHSWGPLNRVTTLQSFSDFTAIYGNDLNSAGYRAVRQAFVGENVRGRRGAGAVIAYRMGTATGSPATKATVTLQNTTPANALRVDAIYEGTRGNSLRVSIRTNPQDASMRDFVVLDGLVEVEVFTYTPGSLAGLAQTVNGVSDWVTVAVLVDGVSLAPVTSVPLAGGTDGAVLVAGDWTATMAALETFRFGYLAPFDLTDAAILASLKAWGQNANAKGRRFTVVTGGALNESATLAVTRASTFNDPDFVTVGVGSVRDDEMLDANGNPVVLSTSQFAPRLAGIMSALGETRSLSGARVGGVTLLNGANESGIDAAFDGGVVVLSQDTDPEAPVHIEKGMTTFTSKSDAARPYRIFREPKFVRTMHDLQTEISEWVLSNVIGQLQVNSKTRSAVVAEMGTRLRNREENAAIQTGWTVTVSAEPPPSDDDDFIALDYTLRFGRSVEQVLNTIVVG